MNYFFVGFPRPRCIAVYFLLMMPLNTAIGQLQSGSTAITVTPPPADRAKEILQWDYARSFLYTNNDPAEKLAYTDTLYHFSSAAGRPQAPTPDEVVNYYKDRKDFFATSSREDRWSATSTALVGAASVASGVGLLYGAEAITVGTVLKASPALIGGSSTLTSSLTSFKAMNDADMKSFLAEKINENLPNIIAAGLMNPTVQRPLAAFLLTGTPNASNAQINATYGNLPATKRDVEPTDSGKPYPVPVLLEAYKRMLREEIQKGVPLSDQDKQILSKLVVAMQKANQSQELLTPKSSKLDSNSQKVILADVKYFTSTMHDVGTLVRLSASEQAQLDKTLGLVDRSASLTVALAADQVNPLAVAASGASILALLFGPENSGPNPFQLIFNQIVELQKQVNQLAVQLDQLRTDMNAQFASLQTAVYQLGRQVQLNREIMLSHFDTLLAEVRGIVENKNLDDWAAFHTSVTLVRSNFSQQSNETQTIVNEIREDRVRENFARLLNHLDPGKGGAGSQAAAGNENCISDVLSNIMKGGKQTFLDEAQSLAISMDKPDYDQRAYCVSYVARELLDGLPRSMNPWLPAEYTMMLPVDLRQDGTLSPWQKERFIVASPLDVSTFLYRLQPEIASIPDVRLRAELSARLLDEVAPLMRSFGVTNGGGSAKIIATGYQGTAVNLAKDLTLLLRNPYQKSLAPIADWVTKTGAIYSGADTFFAAFHPIEPTWTDRGGKSFPLYQVVYDLAKSTKEQKENFQPRQREAIAARASEVDRVTESILGGIITSRDTSLQVLGTKADLKPDWSGSKISIIDVDPAFKRHIPTAAYPVAFAEIKADYSSGLKTLSSNIVGARYLDGVYQRLFTSFELNIKCTWHSQPPTASPDGGQGKGAIEPNPPDLEVPSDCSDKVRLSQRKWEDAPANYGRLLQHANDALNNLFPDLTSGLSKYLETMKDPISLDLLNQRIIGRAFALKVIEILYQRRARAANVTGRPKVQAKAPALNRLSDYGAYVDAILLQTSSSQEQSLADRHYIEELLVPRPMIQKQSTPVTLHTMRRYDYPNASMYFGVDTQMDPMRAGVPEMKKIQYSSSIGPKQESQVVAFLASPRVANVSSNQAVMACAQQYQAIRELLSMSNLELAHVELTKKDRANEMDETTK